MVEHFENETNKKFNQSINVEYLKQYRLDPLVKTKAEQGQTLKQVRNQKFKNMLKIDSFGQFRFAQRAREVISPLKLTSAKVTFSSSVRSEISHVPSFA
jgi:hypothetical protein